MNLKDIQLSPEEMMDAKVNSHEDGSQEKETSKLYPVDYEQRAIANQATLKALKFVRDYIFNLEYYALNKSRFQGGLHQYSLEINTLIEEAEKETK
jgi:hypothetical protein